MFLKYHNIDVYTVEKIKQAKCFFMNKDLFGFKGDQIEKKIFLWVNILHEYKIFRA